MSAGRVARYSSCCRRRRRERGLRPRRPPAVDQFPGARQGPGHRRVETGLLEVIACPSDEGPAWDPGRDQHNSDTGRAGCGVTFWRTPRVDRIPVSTANPAPPPVGRRRPVMATPESRAARPVVIVGAGLAGLTVALHVAEHLPVVVLAKRPVEEGATAWRRGRASSASSATTTASPRTSAIPSKSRRRPCRRACRALHRRTQRARRRVAARLRRAVHGRPAGSARPAPHARGREYTVRRIAHAPTPPARRSTMPCR